jgi:hypothetical protein
VTIRVGETTVVRVIRDRLLWSRVGEEVVILDQRTEMYLGINPTGAVLWDLLVAGCRPAELVSRLADEYGVSTDVARRDVDVFLGSLRDQGLLDETGDDPPRSR